MSEIKLPVRECVMDAEGAFADATGRRVESCEIVAALNAAPKRAFAELTAKTYGELASDALLEVKADPGSFVVGDAEYSALVDAAVLRRLQAFAAPVASQASVNALDDDSLYGLFVECGYVGDDPEAVATIMKEGIACLLGEASPAPVAPAWEKVDAENDNG
jgi:hypothetical protein